MNSEATNVTGWAEQRPLCPRAQGTILTTIPGKVCRVIINASLGQNQSVSLIAKQKAAFPLLWKMGREREDGYRVELPGHFIFQSSGFYGTSGDEASAQTVSEIKQTSCLFNLNPISQVAANLTFKDVCAQTVCSKGRTLRISWLGPNPIYSAKISTINSAEMIGHESCLA